MNTKLFKRIHDIFKKHISCQLQANLFLFLTLREGDSISDETVSKQINGKRSINKKCLEKIQSNQDWTSSGSNFAKAVKYNPVLHTDLKLLHKEYLPNIGPPDTCNDVLGNLVRFCFCGNYQKIDFPVPEPAFNFNGSISNTRNLIERNDILDDMRTLLEKYGMLILSGGIGTGKKSLFKCFYKKNHNKTFKDFYKIEYKYNSDKFIESINFKTSSANKDKSNWELLSLKSHNSLLYIEDMDCPPEKMEQHLKALSNLQLKIIIVTKTARLSDRFPVIRIPPMTDSQLSQLFRQENPDIEEDNRNLKILFELLERNPLEILLAAKYIANSNCTVEQLTTILKNAEFNTFKASPPFYYNGVSDKNYSGHMRALYRQFETILDKKCLDLLETFSCLGNASVSDIHLRQWIPDANKDLLQSLVDMSILSETTPGTFQMQRLIADAVFFDKKILYKSKKTLISGIHKCIKDFRYSFHQTDIHDAFHEVASRLSYSVTDYNNPNQYSPSKEQEAWWEFILDGIIYLLSSDRTECASHLLEGLYVTAKGTMQSHPYYIFKEILDIHNKWINGRCFDQLIFDIDQLQKYTIPGMQEHWQKPYQWLPALTYLETIQVDFLHHFAMHSLMHSLLSSAASGTLSKNGVSLRFHLNDSSLNILTEFFLQTPCLEADERIYYIRICEYLGFDTFNHETLCYLTCKMYKNYQCCCLTSVCINYICTLVLLFSACAIFSAAGFTVAVPHHKCLQHFKELLDAKISDADILPKMVSNLCITAYYYYAFCIQSTSGASSARKQIQKCCDKTPGLLKSEVDSLLKIFDETWEPGQS